MTKLIVTITPPTPNGDLHIGHLAGPFLSADVFARVQRQQGHECILISYSDDYQSYMVRKGIETGRHRLVLARENTVRIKATLSAAGIEMDRWMSPYENPYFLAAAREIYQAAVTKGHVRRHNSAEPYCPRCDTWGYEAFGRGLCNFCGSDSDASQCECCAYPPDAAQMADFRCKLCRQPFEWRTVEREFLDMRAYTNHLRKIIYRGVPLRRPMDAWVEQILHDGPAEWGITRPYEAGLDLRSDGSCRLHTWFLGIAGYMAVTREYGGRIARQPGLYDAYWRQPGVSLVHFLGYDCAYSHMVVYPSLLSNLDGPTPAPQFYPNQFLKLDGKNLSTSRNHAIWGRDLIREYGTDAVRLYLASIAPEEFEGDFRTDEFRSWYRTTWQGTINALIDHAGEGRAREHGSRPATRDDASLGAFRQRWTAAASRDTFSMRALAGIVFDLIALGRERMALGQPVAEIVHTIGVLGQALHPALSDRIARSLDTEPDKVTADLAVLVPVQD